MDRWTSFRLSGSANHRHEERQESQSLWKKTAVYDGWNRRCSGMLSGARMDARDCCILRLGKRIGESRVERMNPVPKRAWKQMLMILDIAKRVRYSACGGQHIRVGFHDQHLYGDITPESGL